jgi:signal transduction histidine kinase
MKHSLRFQLSLWVGVAVLVIVFYSIFVTQQITVWSLEKSIDEDLLKRGNMVASIIASDITTDEDDYARVISDLASQEYSFVSSRLRVISPAGSPIIEFGKMTDPVIQRLNSQLQSSQAEGGLFDTIKSEEFESLRSYTILVYHPRTHVKLAYVQIIESLSQIEVAKQSMWRNGIINGLLGSIFAIIIGLLLIQHGFKPLTKIVAAIDKADYYHLKSSIQEGGSAELEQLAKSLSAMWLRLDMAVTENRHVIGNMSHDLRTPLTALQGQLEVLLTQPSLLTETKASLELMLNETQRLSRMVKNMLLNVQLGSRPVQTDEQVNLKDVVDSVVRDMWVLVDGLKFNIVAPEDIYITGNQDLLIQMLINIVDNAIKFTLKDGKVELQLTQEKDHAVLKVSDTGRGIPDDQLPHVTEAYYKVGLTKKSAGEGSRLGLAIVKQIVDIHHGKIKIKSMIGVGTTVIVWLPLQDTVNSRWSILPQ